MLEFYSLVGQGIFVSPLRKIHFRRGGGAVIVVGLANEIDSGACSLGWKFYLVFRAEKTNGYIYIYIYLWLAKQMRIYIYIYHVLCVSKQKILPQTHTHTHTHVKSHVLRKTFALRAIYYLKGEKTSSELSSQEILCFQKEIQEECLQPHSQFLRYIFSLVWLPLNG